MDNDVPPIDPVASRSTIYREIHRDAATVEHLKEECEELRRQLSAFVENNSNPHPVAMVPVVRPETPDRYQGTKALMILCGNGALWRFDIDSQTYMNMPPVPGSFQSAADLIKRGL